MFSPKPIFSKSSLSLLAILPAIYGSGCKKAAPESVSLPPAPTTSASASPTPSQAETVTNDKDDQIKALVSKELNIPKQKLEMKNLFVKDLGADSLDCVELVMAVEEHFNVTIADEDVSKLLTLQDLSDYLKTAPARSNPHP